MTSQKTFTDDNLNGHHPPTSESAVIEADESASREIAQEIPQSQEAIAPSPRRRPPKLLLGLLGLGLIMGGIGGWRWWAYASTHVTTDDAQLQGHIYPISSRVSGTVKQVLIDDNQPIKAGELLVQLDPHDYQVKVQQAQAALDTAQQQTQAAQASVVQAGVNAQAQTTTAQGAIAGANAAIADAQAALTVAQAGVPAAQAELSKAEATLQKATTDYQRYQTLYAQGAVSAQERDAAKQTYDVAMAQRQSAQEQVRQAQAKVVQAQEGIAQAQAQLKSSQGTLQQAQASGVQTDVNRSQFEAAKTQIAQAQANLKEAELQLSYTEIAAPAAGTVGNKTVEVGQQVQAGQPLMAVVGDDLWIEANFKETQLAHIQPGDAVEIDVDAFPDHPLSGQVESVSPASGAQFALLPPDNATGNFTKVVQRIPIKISLDAQSLTGFEHPISPGMSVTVSVDTGKES